VNKLVLLKSCLQTWTSPARKLSTNLYDIYHCWVYSK